MILLGKSENRVIFIILVSVILSNFIDLKFYEVDKVDGASDIIFSIKIEKGLLLEDYELRNQIGEKKNFTTKIHKLLCMMHGLKDVRTNE